MKIKITQLEVTVLAALKNQGYDNTQAHIIKDMLMYAQLRGNNQGVVKLIGKGIPKDPQAQPPEITKETKLSAVINGHNSPGAVVMSTAVDMALTKAKDHGFGIVGTNNTSSSTGALGYWAGKISKAGFIGFVFAGSPETVAMYGSYEPIFGTNPLAIGIPTPDEPLVLDMATAAMAYYGLIEAKTAGRKIPEGIAYDQKGNPTTDPALAMDGALLPFDRSYKSAGLSLMVEILTGPLVGAAFTGIGNTSRNWGNLVMAIDPALVSEPDTFKGQVAQLCAKVKSTEKLPQVKEIMLPSERGNKLTESRRQSGEIVIEDNLYNELIKAAA